MKRNMPVNATPKIPSPDSHQLPRLLVRKAELAAMLGVGETLIDGLNATGRLPRSMKLGRCRVWSLDVIHRWVKAGMPSREIFEQSEVARSHDSR
jgi:predicted DNA-binding transcriptional regulator AlpA